jgi:hypothetical protein
VVAAFGIVCATLVVASGFRSVWELGLDALIALGAAGVLGWVAASVRFGGHQAGLGGANTLAAVAGIVAAAAIGPAALGLRAAALARRYGHGVITPSNVAVITADLHADTDPGTCWAKRRGWSQQPAAHARHGSS